MITRTTTVRELKDMAYKHFSGKSINSWDLTRTCQDGGIWEGFRKLIEKTVSQVNDKNYTYCCESRGQVTFYLNGYSRPTGLSIVFRRNRETRSNSWGNTYEYYLKDIQFTGFNDDNTVADILKVIEDKCLDVSNITNQEAEEFINRLRKLGVTWQDVESLSSAYYGLSNEARQIVDGRRSKY